MNSYTEKLKKVHKKHQKAFTPADVKKPIDEPEPKKEQNEIIDHWQPRRSVPKGFYKK